MKQKQEVMFPSRGRLSLYIQMSSVYSAKLGPVGGICGQKQKPSFFFFQGPVPRSKTTCASSVHQQDSKSRTRAARKTSTWPEDTYPGRKTCTPEDRERGHPCTT
nr:putative uncharacterized protein encoded by LINC00615 [Pan troglodytes]